MRLLAVVQARMGSQRLPGKVMLELGKERRLIDWILQRVARAERPDGIIIATTNLPEDDVLVDYINQKYPKVEVFRGSSSNVLSRFKEISELYQHDYLLRITADCPLVCPTLIDEMYDKVQIRKPIYAANCNVDRIIKGFDLEFIESKVFARIPYFDLGYHDLEHVTPYFYSGKISESKIINFKYPELRHASTLNLSIDTEFDLFLLRELNKKSDFFHKDYYQIVANLDEILELRRTLLYQEQARE